MKNRLVAILAFSLVASLLAAACSGSGGRRRSGGNNTIKLDGATTTPDDNDTVDLKKGGTNNKPDLAEPPATGGDLSCQELFGCMQGCADGDTACLDDCWNNTSADGQSQFNDIFNCVASYCVDQGQCEVDSSGTSLVSSPTCSTCLGSDGAGTACDSAYAACQ